MTAAYTAMSAPPPSSITHFQWPANAHSHHFAPHPPSPPPSQLYNRHPNHHTTSFDLPDLPSSFAHSSHAAGFPTPASVSSADSTDSESLHFTTLSSFSSPSSLSSSPYSSTPSSTSCQPAAPLPSSSQHSNSRRKKEHTKDAAQQQQQPHQHSATADTTSDYTARRLKHRQIDAARRTRELTAISRLQQLSQQLTHIPHFDQQHFTPASRRRAAESRKDKVSVLEEAVDRMESLYELIEQLSAACLHQYDSSRSRVYQQQPFPAEADTGDSHILPLLPINDASLLLPTHTSLTTHSLPLAAYRQQSRHSEAATTTVGRHSLYSAFFLSAALPMLTVRCDTGQVLDVNGAALAVSGWQPHHLIGRRITSPYEIVMASHQLAESEWIARETALYAIDEERILVDDERGGMVGARLHQQYATSNELERKLYGGEVSVIQAVWRLQLKNGRLHECTATQWCGGWMDGPDGAGGMRRQPGYMVYVLGPESIVDVN